MAPLVELPVGAPTNVPQQPSLNNNNNNNNNAAAAELCSPQQHDSSIMPSTTDSAIRSIVTADDSGTPPSPKRRRSGRDTNRIRMSSDRHGVLHMKRMEELFFNEGQDDDDDSDNDNDDDEESLEDAKAPTFNDQEDPPPPPRRSMRQAQLREQREQEEQERKKTQEKEQKKPQSLQESSPSPIYPTIKVDKWSLQRVYESPNIYIIDDFLTESELEYLDTSIIGKNIPFQRSYVDNTDQTLQDDAHRTSSFVSLRKHQSAKIAALEHKAATLLGLCNSVATIEPLQLVRYLPGQFFGVHHDMGDYNEDTGVVELPQKHCLVQRRLVTIFCYLNDLQEGQGGCTAFPKCQRADGSPLQVQPRRGRAVVWSNVTPEGFPDARTIHAGEPVIDNTMMSNDTATAESNKDSDKKKAKKGSRKKQTPPVVKYGLNIWMLET